MRFLAQGILPNSADLLGKIVRAFALVIGFRDVAEYHCGGLESINELGHLCVHELVPLLDQCYPTSNFALDFPPDKLTFLDVYISLVLGLKDLAHAPFMTLKCLLESMVIIVHKWPQQYHQDTKLREVLSRFVDLLSASILLSDEIQQLIFTASHAFFATRGKLRPEDELAM
jgi:hypothetical protein